MVEEELGEHGCSAGVPGWKCVGVHGQVVQQARVDIIWALPLGQLLQTSHHRDVQEQGYKTRGGKGQRQKQS